MMQAGIRPGTVIIAGGLVVESGGSLVAAIGSLWLNPVQRASKSASGSFF
jgi:hypothetical protein